MKRVRHIVVVGAGLAGLACATAAAAAGARVEVFDRGDGPSALPAHVDVVPNLLRDLASLGVADACVRDGFVHQGLRVLDAGSATHFDVDAPRLAGPRYPAAIGIGYGALLHCPADAACRHGARLHWRQTVDRVAPATGSVRLAGGREQKADLVLLASGIDAPLRAELFAAPVADAAAQDWWHALLPRPLGVDRSLWIIAPGGRKAQLVPVSMHRAGVAVLRPVALRTQPGVSRAASLREALRGSPSPLAALADHLSDDAEVTLRPVRSALLDEPWYRGAVLAVGESAHAIPPHFGQPAAQSLEDAVVLGSLLREELSLDQLLPRFTARRFARAAQVHALATQAAHWDLKPGPATDLQRLSTELAHVVAEGA